MVNKRTTKTQLTGGSNGLRRVAPTADKKRTDKALTGSPRVATTKTVTKTKPTGASSSTGKLKRKTY